MAPDPSGVTGPPSSTLFLVGGGTGGHVYPALAVAEALRAPVPVAPGARASSQEPRTKNQEPGDGLPLGGFSVLGSRFSQARSTRNQGPESDTSASGFSVLGSRFSVVYVGSQDGMEAGLVASESDLPFRAVPAAALRGRAPWTLARNAGTLARGTLMARRLIATERPLAILGTGGYVCVPLFLAARAAGVPTAIYLPDVVPGLAVRFLARLATRIACSVADSIAHFGPRERAKVVVTGYPVRGELFGQDRAACRAAFGLAADLPVLLVYGGSRGARTINRAIEALLEHLLPIAQVVHVCGREGDETFLRAAAARLPGPLQARYRLYPYLFSGQGDKVTRRQGDKVTGLETDSHPLTLSPPHLVTPSMVQAFGAADLVICRSGASTLGELPAAGLPALLVPLPIPGIHQGANAEYLARHGAAVKVRDEEMLGGGRPAEGPLFRHIRRLLERNEERTHMVERSLALAQPDAAGRLATVLLDLATRRGPA